MTKPFLGKPYIKYGQCYGLWGYFFQLGGVLGARHSANLDAFGPAFLGLEGAPGAVGNFFTKVAPTVMQTLTDSMTCFDYVGTELVTRLGYSGDPHELFMAHGMEKVEPEDAAEQAWQYAEKGAAVGAIHPDVVRRIFERQNTSVSEKDWELAHAAGLGIPPVQDRMSYEELEAAENEGFMAYCQDYIPTYYAILSA